MRVASWQPLLPIVITDAVSNITATDADCGGEVLDEGSMPVTARGVCWSIYPSPSLTNSHTNDGTGLGVFSSRLTGLTAGTTYYVRAYATSGVGTEYGNEVTFVPAGVPVTTIENAWATTKTSITSYGWITNNGGSPVTEYGFCYNTTGNPTTSDSVKVVGYTDNVGVRFTGLISGLTPNTLYYVRVYAINAMGTGYSSVAQIRTDADTVNVQISGPSAINWGDIATLTASGANTYLWDTGETTPSISVAPTSQTTYGVTGYDQHGCSGQATHTINVSAVAPTLNTYAPTGVMETEMTARGEILTEGSGTITSHGFCYNTTGNPTISDSVVDYGTYLPSTYDGLIDGLTAGTTYYIRAFATNQSGATGYGQVQTATTKTRQYVASVPFNNPGNPTEDIYKGPSVWSWTPTGGFPPGHEPMFDPDENCWSVPVDDRVGSTGQVFLKGITGLGVYDYDSLPDLLITEMDIKVMQPYPAGYDLVTAYGSELSANLPPIMFHPDWMHVKVVRHSVGILDYYLYDNNGNPMALQTGVQQGNGPTLHNNPPAGFIPLLEAPVPGVTGDILIKNFELYYLV